MPLLVVYASRHGATAGIAARIVTRLVDSGASVDLRMVDEVETLDPYDAVVLGAPVYDQSWPPEANVFVARNRDALAARPLWLFSVGAFGETKRLIGPLTRKEPKGIERVRAELRAREYRVFQGVIHKHQWPFFSRVFFPPLAAGLAIIATGRRSTRGPTELRLHCPACVRHRWSDDEPLGRPSSITGAAGRLVARQQSLIIGLRMP